MTRYLLALPALVLGCAEAPTALGDGLAQCWFNSVDAPPTLAPAILDGVGFVNVGGDVRAYRLDDGREAWRTPVTSGTPGLGRIVARNGTLVLPATTEALGLDASSGQVLWRFRAPSDGERGPGSVNAGTPALTDSRAFIAAFGPSLTALDLRTGAVAWQWVPPDTFSFRAGASGAAVSGDTVYIAGWTWLDADGLTTQQWLMAFSASTGQQLWQVAQAEPAQFVAVVAPPVIVGRTVALTLNVRRQVFVFDRFTAEPLWRSPFVINGSSAFDPPFGSGDTLFVPGPESALEARRATDGFVFWRWEGLGAQTYVMTRSRIYAEAGRTLYVIDRARGFLRWSGDRASASELPDALESILFMAASDEGRVLLSVAGGVRCLRERAD